MPPPLGSKHPLLLRSTQRRPPWVTATSDRCSLSPCFPKSAQKHRSSAPWSLCRCFRGEGTQTTSCICTSRTQNRPPPPCGCTRTNCCALSAYLVAASDPEPCSMTHRFRKLSSTYRRSGSDRMCSAVAILQRSSQNLAPARLSLLLHDSCRSTQSRSHASADTPTPSSPQSQFFLACVCKSQPRPSSAAPHARSAATSRPSTRPVAAS